MTENYPDLGHNAGFRDQVAAEGTENRIAVERRRANETVQEYNTLVRSFRRWSREAFVPDREVFHATTAGPTAPSEVKFEVQTRIAARGWLGALTCF